MRTHSVSPDSRDYVGTRARRGAAQTVLFPYLHCSTQTEQVVVLTITEAAELRDQATTSTMSKRIRDDESEDEPTAKRQQFSTPQGQKSNTLWMFGEKANGDHPRTAPSKSLAASSLRRPARGPISRRNNLLATPQRRTTPSKSLRANGLEQLKPIKRNSKDGDELSSGTALPQSQSQSQSRSQHEFPETPSGGLFGSLRGIVSKGWDFAASLSPIVPKTAPQQERRPASNLAHIPYPKLQATVEDPEPPTSDARQNSRVSTETPRHSQSRTNGSTLQKQPGSEPVKRYSRYDHLHHVSADSNSIAKAVNGDLEQPRDDFTPPSPTSRLKAQNPQLSNAAIESIVKRRERKAAMDEERSGPTQPESEATVAPLFGPDSHYVRGTADPRFLPSTPVYGSGTKRKIESVEEELPRLRNGGFGIEDDFSDDEHEPEMFDAPSNGDAFDYTSSPAKKQKMTDSTPVTPRSALKKPGGMGSVGRKSVTFGGSMARDIRYHYGPAGQYKGSTFADYSSPRDDSSVSSIDHTDVISPTTHLNTLVNSGKRPSVRDNLGANVPHIDFTLRDPNDDMWRPSLANPRPGSFRVPDVDEEDPDESMSDDTPEQPQTPRLSHAELPGTSGTAASQSLSENGVAHEPTEVALDKARLKAEKYKPKSSSRLSNVEKARSRSPSPEGHTEDEDETITISTAKSSKPTMHSSQSATTAPAVQLPGAPPQPFVPKSLDNVAKGVDGLTEHEREHQYDEWAASLAWDSSQTYEDAGTGSSFIHNLIRKNWAEEDSIRSESFWAREFEEVDAAMKNAEKLGHKLNLVTGMEGVEC